MSFFGAGGSSFGQSTPAQTQEAKEPEDIQVQQGPSDSISSLAWSPAADFLSVASWDNQVRIYEIQPSGQSVPKASYQHEGPVLATTWSKDGTKIISGGGDKAARMFDVTTGQSQQVAQHDQPIKCVRFVDVQGGVLATGSWDKTIKYWDLRQQQPVATVNLPERCYAMDTQGPLMVVATAERHIQIYNLNNPTSPHKTIQSPLKWQTRCISCFPDSSGYAVGSVEGRVAIQYIDDSKTSANFSFKCHRKEAGQTAPGGQQVPKSQTLIWAVNDISFHQQHGTFSTAGSDGTINLWDKDSKTRLKTFEYRGGPIACTGFNASGSILAYAVSYDWHQGHGGNVPNHPNKIMLHACKDDEVKKRVKK